MTKKIMIFLKKEKLPIILISIFLFFFLIFNLSPISSDDWGNYIIGERGPRGWVGGAIGMYFSWEGRFISRLFINALTYNKILWNIINTLLMVVLFYTSVKIINPKNKIFTYLLLFLGILVIGFDIFTQTYLWIAGNITYFFPMVFLIIYIYLILLYNRNLLNKKILMPLLIIISLIVPMFVENMGISIIAVTLIYLIYKYIKDKKIDYLFLSCLIISIISLLSMLLSPGNATRLSQDDLDVSLFQKIIINIPTFIKYTISTNDFLLFIIPITFITLVFAKIKNKKIRILSILFNIIPYITILYNLALYLQRIQSIRFFELFTTIYYIIYLLLFLILIIWQFKLDNIVFLLFSAGLISNTSMLVSPIWGARTTLFTVYSFIILNIFVLDNYYKEKFNLVIVRLLKIIIGVIIIMYITLYVSVNKQMKVRKQSINDQLENNTEKIVIEALPRYAIWNGNPNGDFHLRVFKQYYNIPADKEIEIKLIKYKYFLLYEEK